MSPGLTDIEKEELVWPGYRNRPATGRADRNRISALQLLKARDKGVGAGVTQNTEQLVEPVVAVKAAASIPHLCEPRPNVFGLRVDGDGSGGNLLRGLDEAVAWQRPRHFAWRSAPMDMPRAYERQVDHSEHQ